MGAGLDLDQLDGDANRVGVLAHAALDNILRAQLTPDLANVHRAVLELERRVARDDEQV